MIISFFSYKGGVGRTQLMANTGACLFYEFNKRVLLIDWDLEAPGLGFFFKNITENGTQSSVIDLFEAYMVYMDTQETDVQTTIPTFDTPYLQKYQETEHGCLHLVLSPNTAAYFDKLHLFDWERFYKNYDGKNYIEWLKEDLKSKYDYILIDSRTGRTPYGGIVNTQMAELSVFVIAPNLQNFNGCLAVMQSLEQSDYVKKGYRKREQDKDNRPLIMPILSRVDQDADLKQSVNHWTEKFRDDFGTHYRHLLENIEPDTSDIHEDIDKNYIANTLLPYNKSVAFGENLLFPVEKSLLTGFPDKIRYIVRLFERIKVLPTNIVYTNLVTAKQVKLQNQSYEVEKDFKDSILLITIEPTTEHNTCTVDIILKTQFLTHIVGEKLLKKPVSIKIEDSLFGTFNDSHEAKLAKIVQDTFLFGDIGNVCSDFTQLLENQRIEQLLFVISTRDRRIEKLPFEAALHLFSSKPISIGFARTTHVANHFRILSTPLVAAPLKILFMAAIPDDLKKRVSSVVEATAVEVTQHHLMGAMQSMNHQTDLSIDSVYPFAFSEMQVVLNQNYTILHLSAYCGYDVQGEKAVLYLEDNLGQTILVRGDEIGELLKPYPSIKLLILNLLGTTSPAIETDIAPYVPSLITTRFQTKEITSFFITQLYDALQRQEPLIAALHYAKIKCQQILNETKLLPITTYLKEHSVTFAPLSSTVPIIRGFKPTANTRLVGSGFVGRKKYFVKMKHALQTGAHIYLYGLGGIGKSTLAEAFLHQYALQNKAEVIIFRNTQIHTITETEICETLFAAFKAFRVELAVSMKPIWDIAPNALEKLKTLINFYPKNARLFILFDNCEHILRYKASKWHIYPLHLKTFLEQMCLHAPKNCHLIFTARYKTPDWDTAHLHSFILDKMSTVEQDIFIEEALPLKTLSFVDKNKLHQAFEGHPKSYLDTAARLKQPNVLEQNDLEAVQTALFADWHLEKLYEHLLPKEQTLFCLVTSFSIPTDIEVLRMVCSSLDKQEYDLPTTTAELSLLLKTLQTSALCIFEDTTFSVPPLITTWVKKSDKKNKKIIKFYLHIGRIYLTLLGEDFNIKNQNLDLALLAKYYFEQSGEIAKDDFVDLSFKLQKIYQEAGQYKEAIEMNKMLYEKHISDIIDSDALANKGLIDGFLYKYDKAILNLEKSLKLREAANDDSRIAESLSHLSLIHKEKKEFEKALKYLDKCEVIWKSKNDKKGMSVVYNNRGQIHAAQGDYQKAIAEFQLSLLTHQEIGNVLGTRDVYISLANIYALQNNHDGSLIYLEQALTIQEQTISNPADILITIGYIYTKCNKYDLGEQYLREAIQLQKDIKNSIGEAIAHESLGKLFEKAGNLKEAIQELLYAAVLLKSVLDKDSSVSAYNSISQAYLQVTKQLEAIAKRDEPLFNEIMNQNQSI